MNGFETKMFSSTIECEWAWPAFSRDAFATKNTSMQSLWQADRRHCVGEVVVLTLKWNLIHYRQ